MSGGPTFERFRAQREVALLGGDPAELDAEEGERSALADGCGIAKSGVEGDNNKELREGLGGGRREDRGEDFGDENIRLLDCSVKGGGFGLGDMPGTWVAAHDGLEGKNGEERGSFDKGRNEERTWSPPSSPDFMAL